MSRRVVNGALLLIGAAFLAAVLMTAQLDVRPTVAIGLLLVIGLGLNLTGLLRRGFPLRAWLRVLAVLVGLATLAGLVGLRWSMQKSLTELPASDVGLRQSLGQAIRACRWLGAALVYIGASVVVLPRQMGAAGGSLPAGLDDGPEHR